MNNSFQTHATFQSSGKTYAFASLTRLPSSWDIARLPYALRVLLENLLRHEDGISVLPAHIQAVAQWDPHAEPATEIAFLPARVVLQDFTGVPCVVDLAAMRDALGKLGGDPARINPVIPSELVIDHSVQVDVFGRPDALARNSQIEFDRNQERYAFLRWGQSAFNGFKVVPPSTGIVHQVNLEHLARVVMIEQKDGQAWAYPDTVFGTDSHTTMINGLGVLGWGVGGIEAEAAMLGQPSSMLIPQVVGFELVGRLPEGTTATDLVLTITQMLRAHGVVGKFVEFFGAGLAHLPLADRATIANMAPEYGATCGMFPIDAEVLTYLRLSGRTEEQVALVEDYARIQGLWHDAHTPPAVYSSLLSLDLATVRPSLAGPSRPQDRVLLEQVQRNFHEHLGSLPGRTPAPLPVSDFREEGGAQPQAAHLSARPGVPVALSDAEHVLSDGSVVIAAITSCTNTSNPAVMVAAGLLARAARARGLKAAPWVKTSLGPGSRVVTDYLARANLLSDLEHVGFFVVGYGCTTCIGNSGPLPDVVSEAIGRGNLAVASVLSGNRNFEGRIHPEVKMNYLASPPLVVAYAIAGTVDIDLTQDPLGHDPDGNPVFLRDLWPSPHAIASVIDQHLSPELFADNYRDVFAGDERWNAITVPTGDRYTWGATSTYVRHPPYFKGMTMEPPAIAPLVNARALALFGDSITTDHISPAGNIKKDSPAGRYLQACGVAPADFNSYGSRRGNDEVMVRGTFANIRIKNLMLGGVEGGNTLYYPPITPDTTASLDRLSIYDAAQRYAVDEVPLVVLAGSEYGTGSSRDWAAKGTRLLGVRAVIAQSFERIHRANLVGMGVLPLAFKPGDSIQALGLDGSETYSLVGWDDLSAPQAQVVATSANGSTITFTVDVLLLTPAEREYYRHGGLLQYVLRRLAQS